MKRTLETIYEDEEMYFYDKLDMILEKLQKLENRLERIEDKLEKNTEDCQKMSSHIDFIESVYSGLKSPLEYMKYRLGFSSSKHLPEP